MADMKEKSRHADLDLLSRVAIALTNVTDLHASLRMVARELTQVFGGPSRIRGDGALRSMTIAGTTGTAKTGHRGEIIVTWMLGGDGMALTGNEAHFDLETLVSIAESVHAPS